jgi:hypothetical protein
LLFQDPDEAGRKAEQQSWTRIKRAAITFLFIFGTAIAVMLLARLV